MSRHTWRINLEVVMRQSKIVKSVAVAALAVGAMTLVGCDSGTGANGANGNGSTSTGMNGLGSGAANTSSPGASPIGAGGTGSNGATGADNGTSGAAGMGHREPQRIRVLAAALEPTAPQEPASIPVDRAARDSDPAAKIFSDRTNRCANSPERIDPRRLRRDTKKS